MRPLLAMCLAIGLAAWASGAQPPAPRTQKERISYFLGMRLAMSVRATPVELDTEALLRGIRDAFLDRKRLLTEEEVADTMTRFEREMTALARKNAQEEQVFLEQNKSKPGVKALPSGLQYKMLREGTGRSPTPDDRVVLHYRGTLVDGTEFDRSERGGAPATFEVGRLIPGWKQALLLMKEGGHWRIFVPSKLAYGRMGKGRRIGPNALLVFDLELVEIKSGEDSP